MISVLINWVYILVTTGITGSAVLYPFYKKGRYRLQSLTDCFFAGLLVVTVYAQFFSVFYKVSVAANFVLLAVCILIHIFMGKGIQKMLGEVFGKPTKAQIVTAALLILLFAYGTSAGYMMYDSDLYHAQSIRWIEEFGAVKGLGNLQSRLAYNSAAFSLTALFSMKGIMGQSLHCVSGLMALAVFAEGLKFLKLFQRKKLFVSDFARVGAIYYVAVIYKEMMSPASDYFTMLAVFYLIIRWLDLLEAEEEEVTPYALLCVFGVFAVTLKISAALILLLALKPAIVLIREKRWKEILLYLGLGLLTAAPYFIRNVILSGFLVYPYTAIDFFAFDWKIPVFMADYDAKEIQVWARGIYDVAAYHTPLKTWLPAWFMNELSLTEKLLVTASAGAILYSVLYGAALCLKRKKLPWNELHVLFVLNVCFLFWLLSAPMMRYGYVFPLLLTFIATGTAFCFIRKESKRLPGIGACFLCAVFLYRSIGMGQDMIEIFRTNGIKSMQQDYGEYEAEIDNIGKLTVYIPLEGDRIGYDKFPSTRKPEDVLPRGEALEDGFLYHYR